ncbi:Homeobox protein knotted-1-like 7-like protein [Drosera capensis]
MMMGSGGGDIGDGGVEGSVLVEEEDLRHLKVEIVNHPLYEQLLSAHVACLRVATPIDQLPLIDAQLSRSDHVLRSYGSVQNHVLSGHERQELDNFLWLMMWKDEAKEINKFLKAMVTQYLLVLCSFKEQLQQHVRVHAVEAVLACRGIEESLQNLTGIFIMLFHLQQIHFHSNSRKIGGTGLH